MKYRTHGQKPYSVVVLHGGPGAAGSVKPLCETLARHYGVLEPFQTEKTVFGQIKALRDFISTCEHTGDPYWAFMGGHAGVYVCGELSSIAEEVDSCFKRHA